MNFLLIILAATLALARPVASAPVIPAKKAIQATASARVDPAWEASDRQYRASYYYAAALAADAQGHHPEALILLKRASEADPKSLFLLKEYAEHAELFEQYDEAANALKAAVELAPDDAELKQKLARFYVRAGKTDAARKLFDEKGSKGDIRALAALDMAEEKWADAALKLEGLLQRIPDAHDEREMYAAVLTKLGRNAEAAAQYERILKADPKRGETAYRLSHLYELIEKPELAVAALQKALLADPDSTMLQDALARTYYRQEKYDLAEAEFSHLLDTNAEDTDSLLYRGMSRLQAKKYKEAEADFSALGKLDDGNPSQLYGLGLAQLWQGRQADAEKTFVSMTVKDPKAVPGYTQLAAIYTRTSRTAEAVSLLESGVKANPESTELNQLLAAGYIDGGDFKKAEATLLTGIQATGNSTALRFQLAVFYDKAGRFADSEKQLNAIIDIEPTNAQALNYLGYSWAERDIKLSEAEALIRRALKVEPDNHYYQDSLGWACYKLGRFDEARDALLKATAAPDPGSEEAVVFEHLAKVYEKLGDTKAAQKQYQRAKQLDPQSHAP